MSTNPTIRFSRVEFTSSDRAISKEMMLMKPASLTLQAVVDQGYGIKLQQAVRTLQGVITGFERLSTSKGETGGKCWITVHASSGRS